jgi:hypothetical protein
VWPECSAAAFLLNISAAVFAGAVQAGATTLTQVFDSADQLERISAAQLFDIYNSEGSNSILNSFDSRSDNKGKKHTAPSCAALQQCRSWSLVVAASSACLQPNNRQHLLACDT